MNPDQDILLVSLADNPSQHLDDFRVSLDELASSLCRQFYPVRGLLELQVSRTQAQFQELHLGEVNEDGEFIPQVFPPLPEAPAALANNANPVAVANHTLAYKKVEAVHVALGSMKTKVLAACGKTISAELRGLPGGISGISLADILQYLEEHYGVATESDIDRLNDLLAVPFVSTNSFRAEAAQMKITFSKLVRFGQPIAELAKMKYLAKATLLFPDIVEGIKDYKKSNAVLAERSFEGMVTYINLHVPTVTTGDMGYVGVAIAGPLQPPITATDAVAIQAAALVQAALPLLLQHFANLAVGVPAAQVAPQQSSGRRGGGGQAGRGGRGGGRAAGRGRGPPGLQPHYCFAHGWQHSHAGPTCLVMINDPTYTPDMRNATAPAFIGGYQGHN